MSRVRSWCLALALAVAYLAGLGSYALTERSEARYVGVSYEMLQSSDYLTPRYNGIKHFHKPPLFYWANAASMGILGQNEAAARLPCALSALATLALVAWWAKQPQAGCPRPWLAPAVLGTAPFFWQMGRVAITDMPLTLLVTGALAAAWQILSCGPTTKRLLLFWLSLGLGFLDKGPVAPLLVALVLLPLVVWGKARWRSLIHVPGIALAALISLPWYLWAVAANPGLLDYFLRYQTLDRLVTTVHQRPGPPWFYLPVLLAGFLPWSPWLLLALARAARAAKAARTTNATHPAQAPPEPSFDLFLVSWLVVPTAFFSCIGSKLPPYVLPMFPAMALLVARHLGRPTFRQMLAPLAVLLVIATACAGQARDHWFPRLDLFGHELCSAALWLSLLLVASALLHLQLEPVDLVAVPVVGMLGLVAIALPALPKLDRNTCRPLVETIQARASGPYRVAMHGGYLFGLPYYLGSPITHVDYPRETRFETDPTSKDLMIPSLPDYFSQLSQSKKDEFFIVPLPMLTAISRRLDAPVIYRDDRWGVVHQRARR